MKRVLVRPDRVDVRCSAGHTYLTNSQRLLRCRSTYVPCKHWITQISMLLQVAHAAVNDGTDSAEIFGSVAHQAAIDCVDGFGRGGDEDDGAGGNGVDLEDERDS